MAGADPRVRLRWWRPLKPAKVTLFTIILYNPENNIRDIRPFCCPLFRHSSLVKQARNQGAAQGGRSHPYKTFRPPLEKCVGYSLKLLDIVQKIWAPLRKFFAPPGVRSWLRACCEVRFISPTVAKPLWDLTSKYYWKQLPSPKFTGWIQPCVMV